MRALLHILILCLYPIVNSSVTDLYVVNSIPDTASNNDPGTCTPSSPLDSSLCNLRSAFGYCIQNVFTNPPATCEIHIYAELSLSFNSTLGALNYSCDGVDCTNHLYIHANNSKITPSDSSSMAGLIRLTNAVLTVSNLIVEGFNTEWEGHDGGVLSLNHSTLHLFDSMFKNNHAVRGGAVYAAANSTISILNSIFISNFADEFGGAVAVDYNNSVSITNCSFDGNQATIGGGAMSMYEGNRNALIENSVFTGNTAITSFADPDVLLYGGGAVLFYYYNDHLILRNNTFRKNRADYNNATYVSYTVGLGGAVAIVDYNDYALIEGCNFNDNFGLFGGGLFMAAFNNHVDVINTTFSFNQAHENRTNLIGGDGGAVDIFYNNSHVKIDGCKFESNIAKGAAGAVKVGTDNYFTSVINSNFTNNTLEVRSQVGGGAIHMNYRNVDVNVENCSFVSNVANTAAGVYVSRFNDGVNIRKCLFEGNLARSRNAGGISIRFTNQNVDVNECNFQRNRAYGGYGGGAVLIEDYNKNITIRNSIFNENEFGGNQFGGGAVSVYQSNIDVTFLNLTIENSISKSEGGGLYVLSNNSYVTLAGCRIKSNYAESGGGYSLKQNNNNFVVVSSEIYKNTQVLQTKHPYESLLPVNNVPQVIFNKTVTIENADEMIVVFDSQTELTGNDHFYIYTNSSKEELLYYNDGFGPWPGVELPPLRLQLNSIYVLLLGPTVNYRSYGIFYGFKMTVYPSGSKYMVNSDSLISENNADKTGGGGNIYFLNDNCIVIASKFHSNTAHDGGALKVQSVNGGLTISRCSFINNQAYSGGGLLLESSNYGVGFYDSIVSGNVASQDGGGVYALSGNGEGLYRNENYVNISGVTFVNNSAFEGGSIYLGSFNVIKIFDAVFIDSFASKNGAAVYADAENDVAVLNTTFQENNAISNGGGILLSQSNTLSVTGGIFQGNVAFLGAGLALLNGSEVTFVGDTIFQENDGHFGGGIALRDAPLWSLADGAHIIFDSNVAYKGSALALANIKISTESLQNLTITNNHAKQGGTVYWLYGANNASDEPPGLHSSAIFWRHNTALYGEKWATQPVMFSSTNYFVTQYNEILSPSYSVQMLDYYGEEILNENSTTAEVAACETCSHECNGLFFSLSGQLQAKSVGDTIEWMNLRASCYPEGFFTVSIEGASIDPEYFGLDSIEPFGQGIMSFRNCYDGEYLDASASCVPCAYGFYSYQFDDTYSCTPCPSAATQCQKNLTDLKSGYWRESAYTTTILPCPYDTCIGGNGFNDALCREGSAGPLCATCQAGYFFDSYSLQCIKCKTTSYISETVIVLIVILLAVVAIATYLAYINFLGSGALKDMIDNDDEVDNKTDKSIGENFHRNDSGDEKRRTSKVEKTSFRRSIVHEYISIRFKDLSSNFKILVATLQILIQLPKALLIKFPASYTSFIQVFQVINCNVNDITPWGCANHQYDYIDKLVVVTTAPFAIFAILFLVFVVQCVEVRAKIIRRYIDHTSSDGSELQAEVRKAIANLRGRSIGISLIIMFLILPSVSTFIFSGYSCINIDPNGQSPGSYSRYYLREDYTIECSGSRYYFGITWASIMVIVYPIGIPMLHFWLLYRHRHAIKHRLDPPEDTTRGSDMYVLSTSSVRILPDDIRMIEFLYRSYLPSAWYFESIETFRRLFFTAFISVISPGSGYQCLVAITMSFFFLYLYSRAGPYLEYGTGLLSRYTMTLVFFTYIGATFIGRGLLTENQAAAVTGLLLGGTLFMILLAIAIEINNYRGYLAYRHLLDSDDYSHSSVDDDKNNRSVEDDHEKRYEVFAAKNTRKPLYSVERTDLEQEKSVDKYLPRSFSLPVFVKRGDRHNEAASTVSQNITQNPLTNTLDAAEDPNQGL